MKGREAAERLVEPAAAAAAGRSAGPAAEAAELLRWYLEREPSKAQAILRANLPLPWIPPSTKASVPSGMPGAEQEAMATAALRVYLRRRRDLINAEALASCCSFLKIVRELVWELGSPRSQAETWSRTMQARDCSVTGIIGSSSSSSSNKSNSGDDVSSSSSDESEQDSSSDDSGDGSDISVSD